jgi:hypothetical protein
MMTFTRKEPSYREDIFPATLVARITMSVDLIGALQCLDPRDRMYSPLGPIAKSNRAILDFDEGRL